MFEHIAQNKTSMEMNKKRKPVTTMVPLFSGLSIIALLIGVVMGAVAGFGYWKISNSSPLVSSDTTIKVIAPPGESLVAARDLDIKGQYITAQANSLAFFEYLAKELNKQTSENSYTISELSQMVSFSYFAQAVNIKVTTTSSHETEFLANSIPGYLEDYVLTEETNSHQQEQQNISKAMETIKTELLKAEQNLRILRSQIVDTDVENTLTYVALSAKIRALEVELNNQATQLSTGITQNYNSQNSTTQQQEYENTLQQLKTVNASSANVTKELQVLEQKRGGTGQDEESIKLDSMIIALQAEINKLMMGYTITSGTIQTQVSGLAEMIVRGNTTGPEYTLALQRIEAASVAMAEAQKQKALLVSQTSAGNLSESEYFEYQIAQIKINALNQQRTSLIEKLGQLTLQRNINENQQSIQVTFEKTSAALVEARKEMADLESQGSDTSSSEELEIKFAQLKIDGLNQELVMLNTNLSSLIADSISTSSITNYLSVGKPSTPIYETSIKLSTGLIIGVILGIVIAWMILNFKWLTRSISKSFKSEEEDGTQA